MKVVEKSVVCKEYQVTNLIISVCLLLETLSQVAVSPISTKLTIKARIDCPVSD